MNIHDYLIEQSGKDWSELLSGWLGVLPTSLTVWLVNRFGDVFAVFEDGSVHMLDVGTGVMQRLADSRDDFATRIDAGNNANNWLMIPLVDQCVAAGHKMREGEERSLPTRSEPSVHCGRDDSVRGRDDRVGSRRAGRREVPPLRSG